MFSCGIWCFKAYGYWLGCYQFNPMPLKNFRSILTKTPFFWTMVRQISLATTLLMQDAMKIVLSHIYVLSNSIWMHQTCLYSCVSCTQWTLVGSFLGLNFNKSSVRMSTSNVDLVLLMIIALTSNANSSNILRVKLEKVLDNTTHPKQQPWDPLGS
jgi:hypothetical protein